MIATATTESFSGMSPFDQWVPFLLDGKNVRVTDLNLQRGRYLNAIFSQPPAATMAMINDALVKKGFLQDPLVRLGDLGSPSPGSYYSMAYRTDKGSLLVFVSQGPENGSVVNLQLYSDR